MNFTPMTVHLSDFSVATRNKDHRHSVSVGREKKARGMRGGKKGEGGASELGTAEFSKNDLTFGSRKNAREHQPLHHRHSERETEGRQPNL